MSLDVNISEPEEFNCVVLHSCIKDLAEVLGISDFEYHVDHISGGGRENYIANIFRVTLKDIDANKTESVIVKTLINTVRQELFHDLHKREVDVYEKILPKFKEIQDKLEEDQRIRIPECLFANAEKSKEVIILCDLRELGYISEDNFHECEDLFKKVKLVLTELAKFHALSFVYENNANEEFTRLKDSFGDLLFQDQFLSKTKLRNYFYESFDMSVNFVTDLDTKKKLAKVRPKLLELLKLYHRPSEHNVLCHGDLWINNILFKQENDQCKLCFLDFQAMRYTSPVNDIIYFLYLCTTSEFRSEHFQTLLSAYYDTLDSSLKLYNIDVNTVFPKKDFEEEVKDKLPFGLLISLVELRIITTTAEDDAILKKGLAVPGSSWMEVPSEIEPFKYRVNDLVQECVDNGVLDQLVSKINV